MASLELRAARLRKALLIAFALFTLLTSRRARAQAANDDTVTRDGTFEWDDKKGSLYLSLPFRDIIDADLENKLSRGFPTTIVFTATVYRAGAPEPLSTTAQTCKVTWDVWEEVYYVERTRSGVSQKVVEPVTTIEGVLRRCAQVYRLLAGDRNQVPRNALLYARGKIQVNPVSQDVLNQIQRWVMRPNGTGTVAAGDALFSTFTGLFLQRIGEADRQMKFTTKLLTPKVIPQEAK
ncbi:MAG TPA: hypothetical protein VGI10_04070 [Polyangiaceae bacterium]